MNFTKSRDFKCGCEAGEEDWFHLLQIIFLSGEGIVLVRSVQLGIVVFWNLMYSLQLARWKSGYKCIIAHVAFAYLILMIFFRQACGGLEYKILGEVPQWSELVRLFLLCLAAPTCHCRSWIVPPSFSKVTYQLLRHCMWNIAWGSAKRVSICPQISEPAYRLLKLFI